MPHRSLGRRIKALRGPARREAIARVVAEYESSEESAVAFCASAGIARVTLTRWRRELRAGEGSLAPSPRFVEVRAPSPPQAMAFEVAFPAGVTLRVASGFDATELERMLLALRATC